MLSTGNIWKKSDNFPTVDFYGRKKYEYGAQKCAVRFVFRKSS